MLEQKKCKNRKLYYKRIGKVFQEKFKYKYNNETIKKMDTSKILKNNDSFNDNKDLNNSLQITKEQVENEYTDSVPIDSESLMIYIKNNLIQKRSKNIDGIKISSQTEFVSTNFINLLKCINIEYTKDLNSLFENKNISVLKEYVKEYGDKTIYQELSILQILAYVKATKEQRKKLSEERLISFSLSANLDKIIKE